MHELPILDIFGLFILLYVVLLIPFQIKWKETWPENMQEKWPESRTQNQPESIDMPPRPPFHISN